MTISPSPYSDIFTIKVFMRTMRGERQPYVRIRVHTEGEPPKMASFSILKHGEENAERLACLRAAGWLKKSAKTPAEFSASLYLYDRAHRLRLKIYGRENVKKVLPEATA